MIKYNAIQSETFTNDNEALEAQSMKEFLEAQDMFSRETAIEIIKILYSR